MEGRTAYEVVGEKSGGFQLNEGGDGTRKEKGRGGTATTCRAGKNCGAGREQKVAVIKKGKDRGRVVRKRKQDPSSETSQEQVGGGADGSGKGKRGLEQKNVCEHSWPTSGGARKGKEKAMCQ